MSIIANVPAIANAPIEINAAINLAIDPSSAGPAATHHRWAKLRAFVASLALFAMAAQAAHAQGSRKDDMVFGPAGHPVAGASIRVCQPTATGTPCSPLATVYTDATLTTPAPNPFPTDGIGNYHFYAPAGRYTIQISGPGMVGATT